MTEAPQNAEPPAPHAGVGSITGGAESVVTDPHAPVNAGSGPQFNIHTPDAAELIDRLSGAAWRQRSPGVVPDDELELTAACFVEPAGFAAARGVLRTRRTVIVTGNPGSGRTATGIRLLQTVGGDQCRIRRLPDEEYRDDSREEVTLLDETRIRPNELLLLNLATDGDNQFRVLVPTLDRYRQAVRDANAHLVMVLSPEQAEAVDESRRLVVPISGPDMGAVIVGHLQHRDIDATPADIDGADACSLLRSVGDAVTFADLTHRARRDADGAGTLQRWLSTARSAMKSWEDDVAAHVSQCRGTRGSALLLSVAMLDGCSADSVFEAARDLQARLVDSVAEVPEFERPGFLAELAALDVGVEADRTVHLGKPDYDAALRNRFWAEFPGLRPTFEAWTEELLVSPHLPHGEKMHLAVCLAKQSLRYGRVDAVLRMIQRWGSGAGMRGRADSTVQILRVMLEDTYWARAVRHRIFAWAHDSHLAVGFARVLIVVCSRYLMETYPDQAIVRLHHLARYAAAPADQEAAEELLRLAGEGQDNYVRVLGRLADRLGARTSAARAFGVDTELLWRVSTPCMLAPHRLMAHREAMRVRANLVTAMTAVMAVRVEAAYRYGQRWLAACARDARWDPMLAVAVEAAGSAGRYPVLYCAALHWERAGAPEERTARHRVATTLRARIDAAQGLFSDPPRSTGDEEVSA